MKPKPKKLVNDTPGGIEAQFMSDVQIDDKTLETVEMSVQSFMAFGYELASARRTLMHGGVKPKHPPLHRSTREDEIVCSLRARHRTSRSSISGSDLDNCGSFAFWTLSEMGQFWCSLLDEAPNKLR